MHGRTIPPRGFAQHDTYYHSTACKNSLGSLVSIFEGILRRLAVDTGDIVDIVPFGLEAAPRVVGRSAAVRERLAVHRKVEAQSANLQEPNLERSSLQTYGVP